jgi:hypothetical protein
MPPVAPQSLSLSASDSEGAGSLDSPPVDYARFAIRGQITGPQGTTVQAEVRVVEFDSGQRRRRAWLGLTAWWTAAGMAAFLPAMRGLLVPGFVALGIYSAVRRYRTDRVVVEVKGNCPACGVAGALEVPEAWQPPAPITCRRCRASLVFTIDTSD